MPTNEMPERIAVVRDSSQGFGLGPRCEFVADAVGTWDEETIYLKESSVLTEREAHKREVEGLRAVIAALRPFAVEVWKDGFGGILAGEVVFSLALPAKVFGVNSITECEAALKKLLPPDPPQEVKRT